MLDIAPGAAVRGISNWYLDQAPPPVLSLLNRHASIQVLALPALRLSLWDAMTLIQSLPLLSDLHAQAPTLDPMPAGVTKRILVNYVCSNYSPTGKRFRCWHFGCVNTLWIPSAVSKCNGVENETKPNGLALLCGNDATDLLSKKRLNEIRRDITTFKSTWSDLRQLYPPRHSDFAPLKEFDDDLDGTLSQAATMAAYGVELLHIALSCTPVDRRLATQTYQMLATLCATLIDTRDQQRCS
ncbi:hypothetical protein GGI01_003705 [Coemansia sp. RSA 376]|nr:hypothetical protein GGI01_003705 [Coemansia sp. RSA 376]